MPNRTTQRRAVAACLNEVWAMEESKLEQIRGFLELRASGVDVPEADVLAAMDLQSHSVLLALDGSSNSRDDGRFVVDGVEVLSLFGTLAPRMNLIMRYSGGTSTQQFGMSFDRAMRDSQVQTIFIEVDSPGGAVSGTHELADKIFAARGNKRVVAVARGMAASGAYYIASAAELFVATPSTEVGSIGVFGITSESSKRHEMEGDRYHVWRAGSLKASGNQYEAVTPERAAALQARVNAPYQMFLGAVARHRNVSVATVEKEFGQGSTFIASEAMRRNMIDRVDAIETVFEEERQRAAEKKRAEQSTGFDAAGHALPKASEPATQETGRATPLAGETLPNVAVNVNLQSATGFASTSASGPTSEDLVVHANEVTAAAGTGGASGTPHKPTHLKPRADTMNPRIKAALFAQGLIDSLEASDEVCKAALSGYFRGNVPKSEEETLKALNGGTTATIEQSADTITPPANNVQEAHDREMAEARAAAELQGAQRVLELQAKADLLTKNGFPITKDQVQNAIDKKWTVQQAADEWTKVEGSGSGNRDPERPVSGLTAGEAEADKFVAAAADALLLQSVPGTERSTLAPGATQLAGERTMSIVRRDLQHRGLVARGTEEEIASAWLKSLGEFTPMAAASTTAADYPNLLAGFVDKRLKAMLTLQSGKFRLWCGQEPSVADLNPRLVVGQSELGRLDDIEGDDGELPQDRTSEKALAWFKVLRKGKSTPLTPIMVTQDQLGAFANRYALLSVAIERTLNDMAVDLLVSNPTSIEDNVALFHADHSTIVASGSGGVPSAAQAKLMRLRMRKQVGIDTTDYIEAEPKNILVPSDLEDEAKQTYYKYERLNEMKVPVTDATLNVHRGTAEVITEGRLDQYSTAKWYGFADPMLWAVIKYVFQQGYENGRRRSWYDASRDTRYFGIETRAALFMAGWRGAVENFGS